MRKRFGAIHSDSLEEYEQMAQIAWEKDLYFYEGPSKKSQKTFVNFDYDERETNNTEMEEETTMEAQNVKIVVMDCEQNGLEVFDFCNQNHQTLKDFDYVSKVEFRENKQITYHFWINNVNSTKYQEIIDVYLRSCDIVIYVYNKQLEQHYNEFVEKMKQNNKKEWIILKVQTQLPRSQSYDDLNTALKNNVVIVKNLQEALQKSVNQFF